MENKQTKILAIDDNKVHLLTIENQIHEALPNVIVYTAMGAFQGLEIAKKTHPDVILLDIVMPSMNGFEVCKAIKDSEDLKDILVVFVTAHDQDRGCRSQALDAGADGFLTKPVDKSELTAQLKAMLRIREANRIQKNEKEQLKRMIETKTKELSESQMILKSSLESSKNIMVVSIDKDYKYLHFSQAFKTVIRYMYHKNIEIGMSVFDMDLSEKHKTLLNSRFDLTLSGKSQSGIEEFEVNGVLNFFEAFYNPLVDENDHIIGVTVFVQNVSNRIHAEYKLKDSEKTKDVLISNLPGVIYRCLYDKDYTMLYMSSGCKELTGYDVDDLIDNKKLSFNDIIVDRYKDGIKHQWEDALKTNQKCELEYEIITADNQHKWIWESGHVTKNNDSYVIDGFLMDITEQKKYHQILQEKENNTRNAQRLLNASLESPVGMIILAIDLNFRYLYFNREHINVMKKVYQADIAHGMNLLDLITIPGDFDKAKANYLLGMRGVSHSKIEEYGDTHKGYYETLYNPLLDDNNAIIGVTAYARDITEFKNAETALKESEERFKALHNASFGGIAIHDHGVILVCNQGLSELSGYTQEELIGMDGLLLIADEDRQTCLESIINQNELPYEVLGVKKNGDKYPLRLQGRKVPYNGKIVRTVEFRDITESKKAEKKLKESEERYRLLYESIDQGVALHEIITDENGTPIDYIFLEINDSYCKLLEITHEQTIGKRIKEVMPDVEQYWIDVFGKVALTGKSNYYENFFSTTQRYYSTYIYSPKPRQFVVIVSDITERKQNEEEIIYLSMHDYLTGLSNRRFFEQQLEKLNHQKFFPLAIINYDINGLKIINDAFGHPSGDLMLKQVAQILTNVFGHPCVVSRMGGDEFSILMPNTSLEYAGIKAYEAKKLISELDVSGIKASISYGIGIKNDIEVLSDVLRTAENDMYTHKLYELTSHRSETVKTVLKALHEKNPREEQHSQRVSDICVRMGVELGMDDEDINLLKAISNLHDIGKIAIDDAILNKTGKLNAEEWESIKKHPEIGYRILSASPEYSEIAFDILSHHERYDGNGYPRGLSKEDIPLRARIITIADSYDAMISERTYRSPLTHEQAIEEIKRCSGTQFDPNLVDLFLDLYEDKTILF